jgi:hypothetical protein
VRDSACRIGGEDLIESRDSLLEFERVKECDRAIEERLRGR